MTKSKIEWTDETWNPVLGCSKVSPGCDECYAVGQSHRNTAMGSEAYIPALTVKTDSGVEWTGEVRLMHDRLDQPLRWRKPRRVFVNSMSDLFHPDVPGPFIEAVFGVMAAATSHTFQVLTKRPQRMVELLRSWDAERLTRVSLVAQGISPDFIDMTDHRVSLPLPNVWLGTSVESNKYAWRANHLRDTPAAVRFISAEPLLGSLDELNLDGIDWLIVGGESGPNARPMHPEWVRDLRDEALDITCGECGDRLTSKAFDSDPICGHCDGRPGGTAFFFKQWGQWAPAEKAKATHLLNIPVQGRDEPRLITIESGTSKQPSGIGTWDLVDRGHPGWVRVAKAPKSLNGRKLDGRTWDEMPAGANQ